jgi:hypothetical protein
MGCLLYIENSLQLHIFPDGNLDMWGFWAGEISGMFWCKNPWQLEIQSDGQEIWSVWQVFFFDRSMLWFYCYLNEEEIGILDEVFLDTLGKFGQWIFNFRDSSHLAFYLEVSIKMYSAWDIPWFDISLTPGIGSNKIMFFPSVFGGLLNIHKSLC